MARVVATGEQDFEVIVKNNSFYVDKTNFIKEWWENRDSVTLITRPRRFGKTLTMNMVERFFSVKYKGQGDVFRGLNIWNDEKYQELQGTYPVIGLSFSDVKGTTYEESMMQMSRIISKLYIHNAFLKYSGFLEEAEIEYFNRITRNEAEPVDMMRALNNLCDFMQRFYGKKTILLLDEYDTPLQEAYVDGYWDELVAFLRGLFNSTFKTNPYLERAIMTGITRVSKESIFSDLNHLVVVTTTSNEYEDSFGFTQEEVSDALLEFGLSEKEEMVRNWYDGFTFGNKTDIYNPWSITNFLKRKKFETYWVNTSSNRLVGELIRSGNTKVKLATEDLLKGNAIHINMDEQIVFQQLDYKENAIWSLLLASGYLKAEHHQMDMETGEKKYDLKLTNKEVASMFRKMVEGWFQDYSDASCNDFTKALLRDDLFAMNHYINEIAIATFSYFDTGKKPSGEAEPERFYHGFVLGLIVDLSDRYIITSNRESGFGRYDVMLEPKGVRGENTPAIIMEFKVHNPKSERDLQETVRAALIQINEKNYASVFVAKGIPKEHIREYGFAFEGKNVRIDGGDMHKVQTMLERAVGVTN